MALLDKGVFLEVHVLRLEARPAAVATSHRQRLHEATVVRRLTHHASEQMDTRGITREEVAEALEKPEATYHSPHRGDRLIVLGTTKAGRRLKIVVPMAEPDVAWVDVDEAGVPVGIELLEAPADIDAAVLARIAERFPTTDMASIKAALAGQAVRHAV